MREAMANAEVGDEQDREDPTVLELERRGAELLGQEEAVYLPTATMGNQIAMRLLIQAGASSADRPRTLLPSRNAVTSAAFSDSASAPWIA